MEPLRKQFAEAAPAVSAGCRELEALEALLGSDSVSVKALRKELEEKATSKKDEVVDQPVVAAAVADAAPADGSWGDDGNGGDADMADADLDELESLLINAGTEDSTSAAGEGASGATSPAERKRKFLTKVRNLATEKRAAKQRG